MFGDPVVKNFTAIDGNEYLAVVYNFNYSNIYSVVALKVEIREAQKEGKSFYLSQTIYETKVEVNDDSSKFTTALKKAIEEFNEELELYNNAAEEFDNVEVEIDTETCVVELKEKDAGKAFINYLVSLGDRITKLEKQLND